jgi:signal peptidase I
MIGQLVAGSVAAAAVVLTIAAVRVRRRLIVVRVRGDSMLPTLWDGEPILVRRCRPDTVRVGDVVVCRWPAGYRAAEAGDLIVKRVAGVAGGPMPNPLGGGEHRVPAGTIVVLSDGHGADSRAFGPLPYDRIVGVLVRPMSDVASAADRTAPGAGHRPLGRT